jgi:hypothetical protein
MCRSLSRFCIICLHQYVCIRYVSIQIFSFKFSTKSSVEWKLTFDFQNRFNWKKLQNKGKLKDTELLNIILKVLFADLNEFLHSLFSTTKTMTRREQVVISRFACVLEIIPESSDGQRTQPGMLETKVGDESWRNR